MKFIEVNKQILDYNEYRKSVSLLKQYLKAKLKEVIEKEGFKLVEEGAAQYDMLFLEFYCREKDLTVTVQAFKQSRERFV